MIYDFAVIGGDMRQVYLANYLKNQRYQVITYATKKEGSECKEGKSFENVIREAKCMIGPVVFSKNGEITGSSINKKMSVETLLQEMTKEQILFGGCINEEIRHECEQKEIKAFDFMKMEMSPLQWDSWRWALPSISKKLLERSNHLPLLLL